MYSGSLSGRHTYSQILRHMELIDSLDDLEEYSEEFLDEIGKTPPKKSKPDKKNEGEEKEQSESEDDNNETQYSDGETHESCTESCRKKQKVDVENPYRGLRDSANPLDAMSDTDIMREYKLSRKSIYDAVDMIKDAIMCRDNRGRPISPLMHFLITLRYLTTGSTQKHAMNGVSQSSISRIITGVTRLLAKYHDKYIKFPSKEETERVKSEFFQYGKFPDVIGCIGCTHVGIKVQKIKDGTTSYGSSFRNENGYHSLRVQVVVGPNGEIYDIDPRCPGSVHENNIFNMCEVNRKQVAQTLQGVFIGSDAYNPTTCIMTSIRNPQTAGDYYYNDTLIKTYTIFYNAVNTLKRRFRCLQTSLYCRFVTQQNIITSCGVIHNIAMINNDILLPEDEQSIITEPSGKKLLAKRIEVPLVDNNALHEREKFIRKHFPSYYGNQSGSYLYL